MFFRHEKGASGIYEVGDTLVFFMSKNLSL